MRSPAPLFALDVRLAVLLLALGVAGACGSGADQQPSPAVSPAAPSLPPAGVRFVDIAGAAGIDLVTACGNVDKEHILETLGSGVAVADYDGDGDLDIYVATSQTRDDWLAGANSRANALYRNEGGGRFTEVAEEAGVALAEWSLGAYFVDYDNDGDKDLFVTRWGPNTLYRNEGGGRFTDVSVESGLGADDLWSTSAAFGDLDNDGDLDLYVANYCYYSLRNPPLGGAKMTWRGIRVFMGPVGLDGEADQLYRNNGDGSFTEVTREAGIDDYTEPAYGLGVVMSDLDNDGDLDIFVANDTMANYLWRNDGGLKFKEIALGAGVATDENAREQAGMGVDAGDYDNDGQLDLVVTNFSHDFNTLHRNHGGMLFTDATYEAKFSDSYNYLVWGTKFFDYDNDGRLDVFMANGHIYSVLETMAQTGTTYKQPNSLYWNRGDGTFENRSESTGPGMAVVESTRGMAAADLDGDGDLDMVLSNVNAPPNVLINEGGDAGSWLSVGLVGRASNRDGIGARLVASVGGRTLVREVNPFGSFLSQSGYDVHFGLGEAERVERLVVTWPSGTTDELTDLAARQRLTLTEGQTAGAAP